MREKMNGTMRWIIGLVISIIFSGFAGWGAVNLTMGQYKNKVDQTEAETKRVCETEIPKINDKITDLKVKDAATETDVKNMSKDMDRRFDEIVRLIKENHREIKQELSKKRDK